MATPPKKSTPAGQAPSRTTRTAVKRFVFPFSEAGSEGGRDDRDLLGGKGANLAEMCKLGLPVPPGFTISTEVSAHVSRRGTWPRALEEQVAQAMVQLEGRMAKRFGDVEDPLLVSVRSGARVSMPGMMDTVLNLGLNRRTVEGLAARSGNPRFAWDAFRRFVQMYGDVVLGVHAIDGATQSPFTLALEGAKRAAGVSEDVDLDVDALRALTERYLALVEERTGTPFPEEPDAQLWGAIEAVFRSWDNPRARTYRTLNGIPHDWGTAVNVVAMVYGNLGETSGTGVAFTRDPSTGEKRFYGEFLMNAQGEDVVAGLRTPEPIHALEARAPAAWKELDRIQQTLEAHYRDMQDLEFTIQDGKLYMLQCRAGKRTGMAALRIAVDLVAEGKLTRDEALMAVDPSSLTQVLAPVFDPQQLRAARTEGRRLTKGLNAGPGAATGRIVFDADRAEERAALGEPVILVRIETSPEDIHGMHAAAGILTARGGMTSHAALVARQMGKVCVAGCGELDIDLDAGSLRVGAKTLIEGDWLSLDGTSGEVLEGQVATRPSEVLARLFGAQRKQPSPLFEAYSTLLSWADDVRTLGVRANADQPDQCKTAIAFGAEGVGLCRTEHMFFEDAKIRIVREMILAENTAARERALEKLLPLQRKDFEGIFKAMGVRPVTIRTLDPPLHEFLPHDAEAIEDLARDLGTTTTVLRAKIESLSELNPMLGHRGCRLGIAYPEITRMQARALFEAACNVANRTGKKPRPEVMIPLIATARELELQEAVVRSVAEEVFAAKGVRVPYLVGTMIELPRAALTAGEIAPHAEFFSFGTNDLTQTTFGISRDDGGTFLPLYIGDEIVARDPFEAIDVAGVGRLMRIAVEEGRGARPDLKLGICGEHGGEPSSVAFCHDLGLDYVSCSPYRLPIARLAAAQAALRTAATDRSATHEPSDG
ncbi:MAG: pyruvate, phosphate dikinase [Planctomycetota bacterium]